MPFTEALRLLIDADSRGAVRGIQAVGKATDKELGKSQKSIDKWSRGLTTAGAGMVALGGAALFGLGKAAMASEDANLAVVKLENTLQNMPKLAGENSKSFIDLAQATQDKTAADADAIVEAEALLGTFNLTGQEIRSITPLVVDFSRKFGVDMTSAAVQVGKALDGNVGALKRNGISIDETLFKTDRYRAVQEALSDQVGGFAEAEGATFAGSLERLGHQLGDLAEGVGAGAVDAFSDLFGVIDGGVEKLNDLSPATQNAIGKVATFGSVALVAAGGMSFAIGQAIKMRANFEALGTAIATTRLRFAALSAVAGPIGVGAALIAAGGAFATYLKNQKHEEILEAAKAFAELESASSKAAAATGVVNDAVKVSTIDFTASASAADTLAESGKLTDQAIRDLDKAFGLLLEKAPASAEAFIEQARVQGVSREKLADWRAELQGKISDDADAITAQDEYTASVQEATGATGEATSGTEDLGGAMGDQAEETEDATTALQDYVDQLAGMTDPIFAARDALQGVRDAQLGVKDAEAEVMVATAELNEALASGDQDAIAEKTRGLEDAQRGLRDAQWETVTSAAEADSALASLKDAMDSGDVSTGLFKKTLKDWVAAGFLTQAQADEAARSVGLLGDKADEANEKRVDIPVTTPGSGTASSELRTVRDDAHDVPNKVPLHVTTSGVHSTLSLLDQVSTRIRQLDGSTATVRVNARATSTGRIGGVPIFHEGTHRVPGVPGSEMLAYVQAGERIISAGMANMGGGSGGGGGVVNVTEIHVHVAGSVLTERGLMDTINRQLDGGARLGRHGRNLP